MTASNKQNDPKSTMAATWALSMSALDKFPASTDLLRVSAFLAPAAIPFELLEQNDESLLPKPLSLQLAQIGQNPQALDELLNPLVRLSLIRRSDETQSYSIHPLVQEVVREKLSQEEQKAWAERAVRTVNAKFPYIEFENWPQCDRLLPHALACGKLIKAWGMEFVEAARLMNQAGYYLSDRGEYSQAEALYRSALEIDEKALGPEHPTTAVALNNLALVLNNQGKPAEAEPLYRRALMIDEKTLGPEHADTAVDLNNLADVLERQGKPAEAEPLYRRALAIHEKALGSEHPNTATNLSNLALLLDRQGKPADAEPLHRRALAIREEALGAEHPDTAISLNNLASFLNSQGKPADAEPLHRRALAICEKSLGPEHPDTILTRNNLIQFYRNQGRNAEADALEKSAPKSGS